MADKHIDGEEPKLTDGGAAATGDRVHAARPAGGGAFNSRAVTLGDAAGKDVGTGAGTVAAGDHNHSGVYQPAASALSEIAGLSPSDDDVLQRKSGAWTNRTPTQLAADMPNPTTSARGTVEKATTAEVAAATDDKYIDAGLLEDASAYYALTDAGPVAVDWAAFAANASVTVTANRQIDNPTNEIPGTWRTILVKGNNTTDRTITFGSEFLGEVPTITDCDSGVWYELMIHCVAVSHFSVSAKKVKG